MVGVSAPRLTDALLPRGNVLQKVGMLYPATVITMCDIACALVVASTHARILAATDQAASQ
jgi:hypothetical protein